MRTIGGVNYQLLARSLPREEFVERFPCSFLLSLGRFDAASGPAATLTMPLESDDRRAPTVAVLPAVSRHPAPTMLIPVRKTGENFPSMITIGRTINNDVVLPDATVSRFHAYFRVRREGLALQDAGSRNGTWVDERRLPSRISGGVISLGSRLRFGQVSMRFLPPAEVWDQLHRGVQPQAD